MSVSCGAGGSTNQEIVNEINGKVLKPQIVLDYELANGEIPIGGAIYVDPLAIGANPSAKIYPDGTVNGSTDNGSYMRLPNGKVFCWSSGIVDCTTLTVNIYGSTSGNSYRSALTAKPYPIALTNVLFADVSISENLNAGTARVRDITNSTANIVLTLQASTASIDYSFKLEGEY